MKVLIVVGFHWHAPDIAVALEQLGHETVTVTTTPGAFITPTRRIRLRTALRAVSRLGVGRRLVNRWFGWRAARIISKTEHDLLIAWSSFGLDAIRRSHAPSILVRGSHHIRTQNELISFPKKGGSSIPREIIDLEELEYAATALITVPTSEIANDVRWPVEKMVVAPYGFPPKSVASPKPMPAERPAGPLRLIFVGEVSYRKGADRLAMLDTCDSVKEVRVVGRSGNGHIVLPQKSAQFGHVESSRVIELMLNSDALILLSREEGMARVGLEAMALGLPLLVTPKSGLGDWCNRGAGICLSDDPTANEIDEAVRTIRENYVTFSRTAQHISETWTWVDHVSLLMDSIQPWHATPRLTPQ